MAFTENTRLTKFIAKLPLTTEISARVASKSMEPTIHVGQKVRIVRAIFDEARVGDVIAFAKGKRRKIWVHRIVGTRKVTRGMVGYVTKGDNRVHEDGALVFEENFIGLVST